MTYADGYAAATTSIEILTQTLSSDQMRVLAAQNIIPVQHRDRSEYDHGASDAWADYQARQRRR
jgi:hypothetical protein